MAPGVWARALNCGYDSFQNAVKRRFIAGPARYKDTLMRLLLSIPFIGAGTGAYSYDRSRYCYTGVRLDVHWRVIMWPGLSAAESVQAGA